MCLAIDMNNNAESIRNISLLLLLLSSINIKLFSYLINNQLLYVLVIRMKTTRTIILDWHIVKINYMRNLRTQQNGHQQYKL